MKPVPIVLAKASDYILVLLGDISPVLSMVHLFLVCLLTPISIMIYQDFKLESTLTMALVVCDSKSALLVISSMYNGRWRQQSLANIVIDVVSFPSIYLIPFFNSGSRHGRYLLWLSASRLLGLIRYKDEAKTFNAWLERKLKSWYRDYVIHSLHAVIQIFLYASLLACIWFYISCQNRSNCKNSYGPATSSTWVINDNYLHLESTASCYARSLYFIMQTLLTVGYGDIHPVNNVEILFSLFVILNGAVFMGYLISAITWILDTKDITTKSFRIKINKIREYFKLRMTNSIGMAETEAIKSRVLRYFDYMNKMQFDLPVEELFSSLPPSVQHEIKMTYYDQLKAVPFFKEQSDSFTTLALDSMSLITFEPDCKLASLFDKGPSMVLLISGKVDLLSFKSTKTLHSYVAGDCIGDFELITLSCSQDGRRAKANEYYCETRSYCTCLVLSYASFCAVLKEAQYQLMDSRDNTNPIEVLESTAHYLLTNATTFTPSEDTTEAVDESSSAFTKDATTTTTSATFYVERKHRRTALASIPQRHTLNTQNLVMLDTKQAGDEAAVTATSYCARIEAGVKVTFAAHQKFLRKLEKTRVAMANHATNKKMAGMLEVLVPSTTASRNQTILPSSRFVLAWNIVLLTCVLYYNLVIPVRLMVFYNCSNADSPSAAAHTAHYCLSQWTWSLVVDYLCDAILGADLILQSRYLATISMEGDEEIIISDPLELFNGFKTTSHFYVDIFNVLPIDLLSLGSGYLLCFRMLKVSTLVLVPKIISKLQVYLDKELNFTITSEAVTVIYLSMGTLFLTMWMGALWIVVKYTGM